MATPSRPAVERAERIVRVDVDTQNGFCHPEGGLYVAGAEGVLPAVRRLIADAEARGLAIVGSVDAHDYAAPEFRENGGPWPTHCVKGTWDQLKAEGTLPRRARFLPKEPVEVGAALDGGRAAIYFEKDAYSLFDNPNAEGVLAWHARQATEAGEELVFEVFGVATDYCVQAAALGLRQRGFRVRLIEDAVRGVAPATTDAALRALREAGVELTKTEAVVRGEAHAC